ncbi:MAG TPA: formyltetrahydrofolate deformylase [Candidatus Acidoferrales bacterium]|nr:formyltetrahydrofolate deformylase [Candidatus Acidoferrales bacterium]
MKNTAILLVSCPDQKGLNAAIHDFIYRGNGNTLHADEHQDAERNLFLMRVEWDLTDFTVDMHEFAKHFQPIADRFGMQWRVALSSYRPKIAIFVSRYDHCLVDLLYRQRSGELACEIPLIVSNHADVQRWADFYHIPLHVIPVTRENKAEAERKELELLRPHGIDLIVLARYMQVLSSDFIRQYPPHRIINIHHSFLPAFVGGKPHQQAFDRGVKLIGATSHYVTEVLDDGPIIEQDVVRISHRDPLEDLIQKGRDLEKVVLSRAVRWHIENRILLYGNKTVIFD